MLNAMWIAKTGMEAQEFRVSTTANNLANAQTHGYKKDQVQFEDLMYRMIRQSGVQAEDGSARSKSLYLGTGVEVSGTSRINTQGTAVNTGRELDMMISGRGFFKVQLPDGTNGYTRNGSFSSNVDNEMVTTTGAKVIGTAGVITTPAADAYASIEVSRDGTITFKDSGGSAVAPEGQQLQISIFTDPASLSPRGSSIFLESPGSGVAQDGLADSGVYGVVSNQNLEASNVSTIEEMIGLVEAQRVYEMNTKVIEKADSMLGTLMQRT